MTPDPALYAACQLARELRAFAFALRGLDDYTRADRLHVQGDVRALIAERLRGLDDRQRGACITALGSVLGAQRASDLLQDIADREAPTAEVFRGL